MLAEKKKKMRVIVKFMCERRELFALGELSYVLCVRVSNLDMMMAFSHPQSASCGQRKLLTIKALQCDDLPVTTVCYCPSAEIWPNFRISDCERIQVHHRAMKQERYTFPLILR